MPQANQLRVDKLLSNISIKYQNKNMIAQEVFPPVPVKKRSDLYRTYDRNFRLPETARADGALSRRHDFNVSTASYILEKHALHEYVTDDQMDNFEPHDLRSDTTEELTDKILLRLEKSVSSLFTSTSWSQNVSLATAAQWSLNTVTSNPIIQMDSASCAVLEGSGFDPTYSIIPKASLLAAKNHDSIIDRIKYTSAQITATMIAGLFDIDKILVPKAVIDSSAEGQAASVAALWNDNVFVGYRPASAGILKPSAGYIFKKNVPMVTRFRDMDRQAEKIEVNMQYQAKVVASLAGFLIKDTLG